MELEVQLPVAAAEKELVDLQGKEKELVYLQGEEKELVDFQHGMMNRDPEEVGAGEPMSSPQIVQLADDKEVETEVEEVEVCPSKLNLLSTGE